MRSWWADYRCVADDVKKITMLGRYAGTVAAPAYDAFKAAEMALAANRYTDVKSLWIPRECPTGIGGKTCQSDGTNCSIHNYRVAFDIDPFKYGNPHFLKRYGDGWNFAHCKITSGQVDAVEGIKNVQGETMFRWLGWLIGDTMHVELQVPPDRCDVDWKTVPGDTVDPPPEEGDGMFLPLKKNDVGEDIRLLQDTLNLTYGAGLTLDGDYGPATVVAVEAHLGKYTGHPGGQDGEWVGGRQWSRLNLDFVKKHGKGVKGDKGDPGEDGASGTLTITGDVALP
jgi:hypothetical protein